MMDRKPVGHYIVTEEMDSRFKYLMCLPFKYMSSDLIFIEILVDLQRQKHLVLQRSKCPHKILLQGRFFRAPSSRPQQHQNLLQILD